MLGIISYSTAFILSQFFQVIQFRESSRVGDPPDPFLQPSPLCNPQLGGSRCWRTPPYPAPEQQYLTFTLSFLSLEY